MANPLRVRARILSIWWDVLSIPWGRGHYSAQEGKRLLRRSGENVKDPLDVPHGRSPNQGCSPKPGRCAWPGRVARFGPRNPPKPGRWSRRHGATSRLWRAGRFSVGETRRFLRNVPPWERSASFRGLAARQNRRSETRASQLFSRAGTLFQQNSPKQGHRTRSGRITASDGRISPKLGRWSQQAGRSSLLGRGMPLLARELDVFCTTSRLWREVPLSGAWRPDKAAGQRFALLGVFSQAILSRMCIRN